jgi:hypothetical protein
MGCVFLKGRGLAPAYALAWFEAKLVAVKNLDYNRNPLPHALGHGAKALKLF